MRDGMTAYEFFDSIDRPTQCISQVLLLTLRVHSFDVSQLIFKLHEIRGPIGM